jgi:hypothetical protein
MYLNNPETLLRLQMKEYEHMIDVADKYRLVHLHGRQMHARKSLLKRVIVWVGYQMMARGYQLVRQYDLASDEKSIPFPCG